MRPARGEFTGSPIEYLLERFPTFESKRGEAGLPLLTLDIYCIVSNRLRRNFLEPVRRLCRNRKYVALGQVVSLRAFKSSGPHLLGGGSRGAHHAPPTQDRRLALAQNENVV